MAKEKKSRVKRILPDIEETSKSVEKLTKDVQQVKEKSDKHIEETKKDLSADGKYREIKKRAKGRPKATHGKIRFTTLLDPDLRDKMNIIRGLTGYEVNEMYNEAVQVYIDKYQQANPSPNLDVLLKQRKG